MEFLNAPNKAAYRQTHQIQIDTYEQARTVLKTRYPDTDFPTIEDLKTQRTILERHQASLKNQQQSAYNRLKELRIVDTNITALLAPHTPEMVFGRKRCCNYLMQIIDIAGPLKVIWFIFINNIPDSSIGSNQF